uniref:Uncharacterized protein n=1 Tax=Ciona savignyi TaxID=51511 RepID=H2Z016_CIOSA
MDETSILDMVLMNNSTSQLDSIQASVSYAHDNNKTNPDKQWCEKCNKKAKELQKKYKRNMDMMKQKIQFTDNLIQMYAKCKSNLEESHVKLRTLEEQVKKKDVDNQLIQTQLKSLLDDKNPTEVQDLTSRLAELEQCNSRLEDKVSGMEMTCQMYENKIHAMKEEEMGKIATKKKHNKEVENLEKELKQVKRKLVQSKADNERLQRKYEVAKAGRRNRRNTGSLTTDSEHNHSMTEAKMDDSMTNESETTPFK